MTVGSIFNLVALLVTLAAMFGYINHRWLKLPHTIGLVIIALVVSVLMLLADAAFPALGLEATVRQTLTDIDFEETLMKGLLSFLLFAGALHVDLDALLRRRLGHLDASNSWHRRLHAHRRVPDVFMVSARSASTCR